MGRLAVPAFLVFTQGKADRHNYRREYSKAPCKAFCAGYSASADIQHGLCSDFFHK